MRTALVHAELNGEFAPAWSPSTLICTVKKDMVESRSIGMKVHEARNFAATQVRFWTMKSVVYDPYASRAAGDNLA